MVDEDSHSTDLSARYLREGTFFIRGGGWAGASEGRVLSNFFTN